MDYEDLDYTAEKSNVMIIFRAAAYS